MSRNTASLSDEQDGLEGRVSRLEKKVYDLQNLIDMGMSLSSNLDFESLVESILYSCIGQMFVEKVSIILQPGIDSHYYTIHMAKGYDREFNAGDVFMTEDSPLMRYLEKNPQPQLCSHLSAVDELSDNIARFHDLDAEILVPMVSKSSINGILVLGAKINGDPFSGDDSDFLFDLAKFAAIAVENSRLYLMAILDRMTRLYIHHYFQERLFEELRRSRRYNSPLALLMADIDHFKIFNDTYGHQQGDLVLKETAQIFRDSIRKIDIPARYGGEEFAVILPETSLESAVAVASRLRKRSERHAFTGQSSPLHVTISIGVAQYNPEREETRESLIGRADRALYRAKQAGRNRVAAFR